MRSVTISILTVSLLAMPALAGEVDRTITIRGTATLRGHADYAIVTFRHEVIATASSADALGACRATVGRAFDVLRAREVKQADIATLDLDLETLLDRRSSAAPKITGFRARQTFQIFVRDLRQVAPTVQAVLDAGVNEVLSTRYRTSRPKAFREHARRMALSDALDKARFMEESLRKRLTLAKINTVDISFSDSPWDENHRSGGSRSGREGFLGANGTATAWDYGIDLPDLGTAVDAETPSLIRVSANVTALFTIN